MDLKLSGAPATDAERAVIAATVPEAEVVEEVGRVVRGGRQARSMRHHLLPALAAVQAEFGWISPGALDEICRRLMVPPAEAYGVATFYALLSTEPASPRVAHVCDDVGCAAFGGNALIEDLRKHVGDENDEVDGFTWKRSPCLGQCDRAPAVFVQRAGADDAVVTRATAADVMAAGSLRSQGNDGGVPAGGMEPGSSSSRLLRRVGRVDPSDVDGFREYGGFDALREALDMGAASVIAAVTDASLKGRGGAAFPTGVKWAAVAEGEAPRYLICNADESEPGTFKDRLLMEGDPFALVESMAIAGTAIGAEVGYLYLRGEYPLAAERISHAIDAARRDGYLGDDVMGSGKSFDIEIRRGQGAYICGEETALMESIEGYRGEPRNKPPFPTTSGLFGRPTVINNVETLLNVPHIVLEGPDAYRSLGTEESSGTRLFCLSGSVARPGTYEVAFGATLRQLLDLAGGTPDGIQAILLGGAAGSFVLEETLDVPLTFEDTRAQGLSLGSGVVMVFGHDADMRAVVRRITGFFRDETCGQCVPCRVGVVRQEESFSRYLAASGAASRGAETNGHGVASE
ncbi:MAG: NAD(P)H-dependent oxidoreductase subunit E, partial [Nitriliruptoraceae bacterium]